MLEAVSREHSGERPLPPVTLVENEHGTWKNFTIKKKNGEAIGKVLLSEGEEPGTVFIVDINRFEGNDKQGYGYATYFELIKVLKAQHLKLLSGHSISRKAIKKWEWLVEKGLARCVEQHEPNENAHNMHYSTSKYEAL